MAGNQRQSLRELQERLASRLAQAHESGADAAWLAVEIRARRYLLPLVHAGEIFPVQFVQKVPFTKSWFLGVTALRGGLMGVVDLGGLLQGNDEADLMTAGGDAKLIALNPLLGVNAVLWVDRLLGLRGVHQFVLGDQSLRNDDLPMLGQILVDEKGQQWSELDLLALTQWPPFLGIAT